MNSTGHQGVTELPSSQPEKVWEQIHSVIAHWEYPHWNTDLASNAFETVVNLFAGKTGQFQPIDTAYHDLSHTLQVTLCWTLLADGYLQHGSVPISGQLLQTGFYAALFHDSGYLKPLGDDEGSGAKFTFVHEKRSCKIAESLLHGIPFQFEHSGSLRRMIGATGPRAVIQAIPFASIAEKKIAQMLATADFLAQIGDPDYPNRLPALYDEFQEAEQHRSLSDQIHRYPDYKSLVSQTPAFWKEFVLPRLDFACEGIYKYLNNPFPDGNNRYMLQAKHNIELIEKRFPPRP